MKTNNLTIKQEAFCQAYIDNNDILKVEYDFKKSYGNLFYVYLLINPINNTIFYIGKGKNKRAEDHLKENKNGRISNAKKHNIINEILSHGLEPNILIFENNLNEQDAYFIERLLIEKLSYFISNK